MNKIIRLVIAVIISLCFGCSKQDLREEIFVGAMQAEINGELVVFERANGYGFFDINGGCDEKFHEITGVKGYDTLLLMDIILDLL
ncbi:hypothetical protein [Hyunsoonleella rubra]|uniref:Uncharacterized protein n=1 Tax=Hyunsoonleella rubra TaxID=1737062 RepID=A0ABW5TDW1_9FLAO